jgi:hypothetical protein
MSEKPLKYGGVNMINSNYLHGADEPLTKEDFFMSDKTKKVIRAVSTGVTICGVIGLFVSGGSEVDVSNAVKVGTMVAAIIGSLVTTFLPKK